MEITENNMDIIINQYYYNENKSKLICPIDNKLILEPLMCSSCETTYCKDCINFYFAENNTCTNMCFIENMKITELQGEIKDIFEALKLKCENECEAEVNLLSYKQHVALCRIENVKGAGILVVCSNCGSSVTEKQIKNANSNDNKNEDNEDNNIIINHAEEEENNEIICWNCNSIVTQKQLKQLKRPIIEEGSDNKITNVEEKEIKLDGKEVKLEELDGKLEQVATLENNNNIKPIPNDELIAKIENLEVDIDKAIDRNLNTLEEDNKNKSNKELFNKLLENKNTIKTVKTIKTNKDKEKTQKDIPTIPMEVIKDPNTNTDIQNKEQTNLKDLNEEHIETLKKKLDLVKYTYKNFAISLYKEGRNLESLNSLFQAIEVDPHFELAYLQIGITQKKQKKVENALKSFLKALEIDCFYKHAEYNIINIMQEYPNEYFNVVKKLEVDSNNNNKKLANYNLALLYLIERKYDESLKYFNKCLELDTNFAIAYVGIELLYNYSKNKDKICINIEKALNIEPNNKFFLKNYAIMLISQQKLGEALKFLLKALLIDPNFEKGLVLLGVVYRLQNNNEESKEKFLKILEIDPNSLNSLVNLGGILELEGKKEEALEYYLKAFLIDPNYVQSNICLANYYISIEKYMEAKSYFLKIISYDAFNISIYLKLADVCYELNQINEAIIYYRKILEIDPNNKEAIEMLNTIKI